MEPDDGRGCCCDTDERGLSAKVSNLRSGPIPNPKVSILQSQCFGCPRI